MIHAHAEVGKNIKNAVELISAIVLFQTIWVG